MIASLRSTLFAIAFYPGSAFFVLAAIVGAATGPAALEAATHGWARFHRLCARYLLGVRTRIEGPVPAGAMLVAAKHQSMYETIEMLLVLHRPVLVMKRELSDIPFWGWVARQYGIIPIDREGGAAALRIMLRAAKAAIAQGRPIVIFPEGTRVEPGHHPPLQPGFAGLYKALGIPVVPLALDSGRLWPRGRFVKHAGAITMRFQPTLPPGLPRPDIEQRVHEAINALD